MKKTIFSVSLLFLLLASSIAADNLVIVGTDIKFKASSYTDSVKLLNTQENKAEIALKTENSKILLKHDGDNLVLKSDSNNEDLLKISTIRIESKAKTFFSKGLNVEKDLVIGGKRQWLLAYRSDLSGFDASVKTVCGPYKFLGGHCVTSSRKIQHKIVMKEHSFVRIKLNYHFIDSWQGESGFLKVSLS